MKHLMPGRKELAIFAVLAVACSAIISTIQVSQHDLWLAALAMPMFIFAAVLGLRRSPQWQSVPQEMTAETTPTEADAA